MSARNDDGSERHIERVMTVPSLPRRPRDAHKGSLGHVACIAGSASYTGAAVLTARAALRGGAGLVTLGCPASVQTIIATHLICEISEALPDSGDGTFARDAVDEALDLVRRTDAVAFGPGISRTPASAGFAHDVVLQARTSMVVDADGLNAFAGRAPELRRAVAPRVLTPHPGEAARLLGWETARVVAVREEAALELAEVTGAVVLLKGAGTLVTDGRRLFENTTGNAGLATGGAGDVLTGLLAALLVQGLEPFEAAALAAHVHGAAADLAAAELGEHGMIATDVLDRLPLALRALA